MKKTKWIMDPTHSDLGFKIRHLMITNISGSIKNFNVEAETEGDDFKNAGIRLTAEMASIFTNNEQRDAHLQQADFFETEKYPTLEFQSTRIIKKDEEHFQLAGELTIKGITKPVTLEVEQSGIMKDPWGGERTGFTVTGKINRGDFGINFNSVLETGGLALAEEVKILAEVQLTKQAEMVPA